MKLLNEIKVWVVDNQIATLTTIGVILLLVPIATKSLCAALVTLGAWILVLAAIKTLSSYFDNL